MNEIINPPAIVATKYTISEQSRELWRKAIWTIKQAQKRFVRAYDSTLRDTLGDDYKNKWKKDSHFMDTISEIEKDIQKLCREAGMSLTTFNRYRSAARKCVLLDVPFSMAGHLSLKEIRECAGIPGDDLQAAQHAIREKKIAQWNINRAAKVATVLPLPEKSQHPDTYLQELTPKIIEHLKRVTWEYGAAAGNKMIKDLTRALLEAKIDEEIT